MSGGMLQGYVGGSPKSPKYHPITQGPRSEETATPSEIREMEMSRFSWVDTGGIHQDLEDHPRTRIRG